MALYSIVSRSYSSLVPIAIKAVRSSRTLIGAVSAAQSANLFPEEVSRPSFVPPLHFSTATAPKNMPDDSLLQIIDSEIKFAQNSDIHDCVVDPPDGFPFEIKDNPGDRIIVLTRKYQDEMIKVEVNLPDTGPTEDGDDADNDDDSKVQPSIPLVVSVSKNGLCLQFDVTALPDEISIQSLSLNEEKTSEDHLAYQGPEFSDLDENLQKAFHKYLEIRGLKPSTANFLLEYMICKDSKEYLQWLKKLKKFMQS